jgi:hypothetical protein
VVAAVGAAGALIGITTMAIVSRLQPAPARPPEAAQVAPAPSVVVESAPVPTWAGRRQATWARDGSKTIAFELQASNEVPVWMTRLRPVLVARCVSRTTEVFVVTGAVSIESQSGVHTVRLRLDDEEEVQQQWTDSASSQELFAPDGVTLVRRLARATRLRFGYTPYNASPVVADFVVHGFEPLAGLVAGTCGWRLDDRGTPGPRPARLN